MEVAFDVEYFNYGDGFEFFLGIIYNSRWYYHDDIDELLKTKNACFKKIAKEHHAHYDWSDELYIFKRKSDAVSAGNRIKALLR